MVVFPAWNRYPRPQTQIRLALRRPRPSTRRSARSSAARASVGSLENPETYENVPGHVIPILEREFDDFDTEAGKFLAGEIPEDQFIGFRLKQGVYGQRQPDVQMIRVKLPFGGVTPEQMDAFANVIEKYVPLNKGHITTRQNIQIHHIPLPDAAEAIREISDAEPLLARGLRQHRPQRHRRPVGRRLRGRALRPDPYAGAYVRYFVRHPTTQLMPRKVKTAFTATDEDRAITGIHDVGFIPAGPRRRQGLRDPGRRRHLDHAPRRPHPVRVRHRRRRRVPEGDRGRAAHLRPPGVAARQPRPRPDQGPGRQDRHRRVPQAGRRGARGRLGRRARLRRRAAALRRRRGGRRPRRPRVLLEPQRRQQGVRPLPRLQRQAPAPGGLLGRPGQGRPAAT